ncbi:MAG: argininosuccinate lyase [Chitinispirillaceae bacterium]|nr:argininosuccinate lyase [Chitinispirillaceae bacterium]
MKMWDGRFSKPSDALMEQFHNSLPFDKTMIEEDIDGSIAWARALKNIGIFSQQELDEVTNGLKGILDDFRHGEITFLHSDEDVHMAVERLLVERVGDAAARLHTGRSRNDQVATDTRMYVKKKLIALQSLVEELQRACVIRAQSDIEIIIPGYTHLQQAQPILLAHYWMSFFFALQREKSRIEHAIEITDIMPLGSGAMAGSGFNLDRDKLASDLGFSSVSYNSIDGVAARDFILESLSALASCAILISRYAEDIIIWSSKEFSFVEIDDAWSTGSSMMPQKKNPDSVELIRGKCGRFVGNYMRFATTCKGVGLTYYKDLQEDKEPIFDSLYQMEMILKVLTQVLLTIKVKNESIQKNLDPFLIATDLADYLVKKGMPFRQAHKVVGKIVGFSVESGIALDKLGYQKLSEFSELYTKDVEQLFVWETAVNNRDIPGGTARSSVDKQVEIALSMLQQ